MERFTGTIKYEIEMRFTVSGKAITTFKIAAPNNDKLMPVITWEQLAEACNRDLQESDEVMIDGYWSKREYKSQNGEDKVYWQFTAKYVGLMLNNTIYPIEWDNPPKRKG